jgi:hypothetical protein
MREIRYLDKLVDELAKGRPTISDHSGKASFLQTLMVIG